MVLDQKFPRPKKPHVHAAVAGLDAETCGPVSVYTSTETHPLQWPHRTPRQGGWCTLYLACCLQMGVLLNGGRKQLYLS